VAYAAEVLHGSYPDILTEDLGMMYDSAFLSTAIRNDTPFVSSDVSNCAETEVDFLTT
jgi:hypothetical protein